MNSILSSPCHVCGGALRLLPGFSTLMQVTSDCRPWRAGGTLATCQQCATIQKPVTSSWLEEANEIYREYAIYSQGAGAEQSTFDSDSGAGTARSNKIVEWLATATSLANHGRMLDIGCGNGAFLNAFSQSYPNWQLTGLELSERNRATIEAIPGVSQLYVGSIDDVDDRFDLIVLIHALEHIPDPARYLRSLATKLKPSGLLLIEVPDLDSSPFDVLIADHATHFTAAALHRVVGDAGFTPQAVQSGFVPKELSLLARCATSTEVPIPGIEADGGERSATSYIGWLQAIVEDARPVQKDCGIFGTSISATWLAASLDEQVSFFVDEDRNRIGRSHMGRQIFHPLDAPANATILLPLRTDIALSVAKRFDHTGCRFVVPRT
jgi:2-polyprenyl-3-methyl-5-hydroxy-6-metoxy-1,4-benzoquinol methylase